MRRPRIGALCQRLALQAPSRSADEGGGATVAWVDVASVWADVEPLSGREIVSDDSIKGRVTHEVRLRYRPGVRPEMRFVGPGERVLEIRSAQDVGERRCWLICQCKERLP